jgi:hypothetical protein
VVLVGTVALAGIAVGCSGEPAPTGDASAPTDGLCAAWIATTSPPGDRDDPAAALEALLGQAETVRAEVPEEHRSEIDAFIEDVRELSELGDGIGWEPDRFQSAAPEVQARLRELNESLVGWGATSPLADHLYARCSAVGAEDPRFHLPCSPSRFQPIPQPGEPGAGGLGDEPDPDALASRRASAKAGSTWVRRDADPADGRGAIEYAVIGPDGATSSVLLVTRTDTGWTVAEDRACR